MNIVIGIIIAYMSLYAGFYIFLRSYLLSKEQVVIHIFLKKVSKIPSLIEVMRPYVTKEEAFETIIELHSDAIVQKFESIYDILELNGKLQNSFLFLMQLSVHIPKLQKAEYFVYIRDFIIGYERLMRSHFSDLNRAISYWNLFVKVKNMTLIGYVLPGERKMEVN